MKANRGVEILAVAAVAIVLAALIGWIAWPSLTGVEDDSESLRFRVRAWVWPVEWEPQTGPTLPSPNYLDHPPQYIPPNYYPPPNDAGETPELKSLTDAQRATEKSRER